MPNKPARFSHVFFDLDGTIIDTAPDIAVALNKTLTDRKKPTLEYDTIRPLIHGGSHHMIDAGFGIGPKHEDYDAIRQDLLDNYAQSLVQESTLFPGIEVLLQQLDDRNIQWGVITNKIESHARKILDQMGLLHRSCCVIGGDTLARCKPDPAPLLHACKLCNVHPQNCVYIGDTEGDIVAARAAGITPIAVTYGYHPGHSNPKKWRASHVVDHAEKLGALLH